LHIIDTAGLRESADPVEKLGIERTWAAIGKADLVVLLLDAAQGEGPADHAILKQLPAGLPRITVMNKIDLLGRQAATEFASGFVKVWLSAKSGVGVDQLRQALLEAAGWRADGEGLFMARERHVQALQQADAHLKRARELGGKLELFAEELRLAQEALGSITGEYSSDDLLGEIFSRFCIGK
jgi:tRNA modification GTPase